MGSHKLFVNVAVKDLDTTIDFFTKLGFAFNPQFTDEKATCMVLGEDAYVMFLVEDFFSTFTTKSLCDTATSIEAILAISVDDRAAVDTLVDEALAQGGAPANEPQDHGFMYSRSFLDPNGHLWEVLWMDLAAVQPQD